MLAVGLGFLPAYRSYEVSLTVVLQLERGKQFRDGSASWVLFVRGCNFSRLKQPSILECKPFMPWSTTLNKRLTICRLTYRELSLPLLPTYIHDCVVWFM